MRTLTELLSANIKAARKALKLRQPDASERCKIPLRTYVEIELGNSWPQLANLEAIAQGLNTTPQRLLSDPDMQNKPTLPEVLAMLAESLGFDLVEKKDRKPSEIDLIKALSALDENKRRDTLLGLIDEVNRLKGLETPLDLKGNKKRPS